MNYSREDITKADWKIELTIPEIEEKIGIESGSLLIKS